MPRSGPFLCLASATAFGTLGIFGKLAYDEGAGLGTLLAMRFALAAVLLWTAVSRTARRELRGLSRRDAAGALALGAVAYSAQAACYFAALERLDASLLALLVYTFPVIVAVTAIVLGRDRASRRTAAVLTLATAGLALVLSTAATGTPDLVGTALGLGAALVYSAYVLAGEGVASRVRPQVLAALVCSGAAASLTAGAALLGELHPAAVTPAGWGWLACLAGISTVASISLFFAGLRRVGPTRASILSTLEPVVAALLAVLVFGEVLRPPQILGIGLVLGAVLALQMRPRAAAAGSAARLDATLCAKRTRPVAITDAVRRSTA